jgi:Fe-S-cluster containining protein
MDSRYQELLLKIDDKSQEIADRHAAELQCKSGCHGCCLPGLSVFPVEADAIVEHLDQKGWDAVIANEEAAPHAGARCSFLNAQGACAIYEVRPVICRTHGLPLRVKGEAGPTRDACPLNFQKEGLGVLPDSSLLNLDLINTLLVLINQNYLNADPRERVRLQPSVLKSLQDG